MIYSIRKDKEKENKMKRLLSKMLSIILIVTALLTVVTPTTVEAAGKYQDKLVVIHTNDIHGAYAKKGSSMGISSVRALHQYYEEQGADVLLLDAGDFSQGNTLMSYFNGADAVEFLNAAGYDAVSLGNHEFDNWPYVRESLEVKANFKVLDANIVDKNTKETLFDSNAMFTFENRKVGVFGLDTPELVSKVAPKYIQEIEAFDGEELFACAREQVSILKEAGCDYIICVGHLGTDDESEGRRSIDLINAVPGIDLFVDGHSHSSYPNGMDVAATKLVSTGTALEAVGVVEVDGNKTTAKLVTDASFAGNCSATDDFVADYQKIVDMDYSAVFAESKVDLMGDKAPGVRTMETNLGDLVADGFAYAAQQYVDSEGMNIHIHGAIQNGGGIRTSLKSGTLTMNDIRTVLPFDNALNILTVSGADLLEALEAACQMCPEPLGGFPQVSGIEYTIDTGVSYEKGAQYEGSVYFAPKNPGKRVTIKSVDGEKFDKKKMYNIAAISFIADGGDTYTVFKDAKKIETGIVDADALGMYVNSMGGVISEEYSKSAGRIEIK